MNHAISITAGRQKVLDFEAEMAKRLESLPIIEADILNVGRLRMRWLDCVANIDGFEADLFRKKLDVMKLKSELAAVRLTCEMARIESCYEAQALNQLIAATKPYEHHETDDQRNTELKQTSMRNLNELKENLINSVKVRDSIASKIYYLIGDCERQKLEFISYRETVMEELSSRISTYMEKLTESMEKSKTHHKTIIGEYLVLRHNAKVAKDILARNQKKNQDERVYLQEQLDKLILESEAQKEKMEKITAGELKVLTNDIRTKVILKERELEEVTSRLEEAKAKRKSVCSDLKSNLRKYERKYDKLQIKRQRDLKEINGELKNLRDMIAVLEEKLKDNKDKENIDIESNNNFNKSLTLATVTATKEIKNKIKAIANSNLKMKADEAKKAKVPLRPKSAPVTGWRTVTTTTMTPKKR